MICRRRTHQLLSMASEPPLHKGAALKHRIKDRFWVKLLKWHLYKRYRKPAGWHTTFAFERLVRSLKPGDVVLDCGANVGVLTNTLAATGATVHAFEPDPYSFEKLTSNTHKYPNVHLYNAAIGVDKKPVKLFRSPDFTTDPEKHSISSSVFEDKKNVTEENFVDVNQIDFIEFINTLAAPVKLTKMDIEGAEVPILEEIIRRNITEKFGVMFVETHESRIPSLAERTTRIRQLVQERHADRVFLDWE